MSVEQRTIKCDVPSCREQCTEKMHGDGWPEWGEVKGKRDTETGSETFGLCPRHLSRVFEFMLNL